MKTMTTKRRTVKVFVQTFMTFCLAVFFIVSTAASGWSEMDFKSPLLQGSKITLPGSTVGMEKADEEEEMPLPLQKTRKVTLPGSYVGMEKADGEERPTPLMEIKTKNQG